jgi:hypothetical protein
MTWLKRNMKQFFLIVMYLGAVVFANMTVAKYGTIAVLPVSFVFIGLDLTSRDYLHELWKHNMWLKMFCLIAIGSLLSWILNRNAGQIALASFIAFLGAGVVDTLAYHLLHKYVFLLKVNGSNVLSAFTDSFIFLTIAFGAFMPTLILAQFGVKVVGGFIWSLLLKRLRVKDAVLSRNARY